MREIPAIRSTLSLEPLNHDTEVVGMDGTMVKSSACPDFEDLSCFIDEELESARCVAVRDHLESCDRCATLTSKLR